MASDCCQRSSFIHLISWYSQVLYSPFLLMLNPPHLPIFLSLHSLINGLHTPEHSMHIVTHLDIPLSKSGHVPLKVNKILEEAHIKRHLGCGGGASHHKIWVSCLCLWLCYRVMLSLRLPMLLGLLPFFFTLLIIILITLFTPSSPSSPLCKIITSPTITRSQFQFRLFEMVVPATSGKVKRIYL